MGRPLPPSNHKIDLPRAAAMTRRFRGQSERHRPPVVAFTAEGFTRILGQEKAVGVRIYPAAKDDGTLTYVLVGVDADGNDMVDGELSEEGTTCPDVCPDTNPLNSGV
jgi:hypothetical protein